MIDTLTKYQFSDEMVKHGFSYKGSKALFNYLEQLEDDCDIKIEFDPIAFRCEYHDDPLMLNIFQHKGITYLQWDNTDEERGD